MLGMILSLDLDVGGGHTVFPDFFGGEVPPWDLEAAQLGAEMLQIAAGVNQGAERHVTANARKTIEIGEFHGNPPRELPALLESRWRRIDSIGGCRVCQTRGAGERGGRGPPRSSWAPPPPPFPSNKR